MPRVNFGLSKRTKTRRRIGFSAVIILLSLLLSGLIPGQVQAGDSLLVYCAAGMKEPMSEIAALYEEETGTRIDFLFGGSGALLSQLKMVQTGDIYFPADSEYLEQIDGSSEQPDYVKREMEVGYQYPVIVTPISQVKVESFQDLFADGIQVALASRSAAIGRTSEEIFAAAGQSKEISSHVVSRHATVNQVALVVSLRQADAGIVWYPNYLQFADTLSAVPIPEEINVKKGLVIGLLNFSSQQAVAESFMSYVISPIGKKVFVKYGYEVMR